MELNYQFSGPERGIRSIKQFGEMVGRQSRLGTRIRRAGDRVTLYQDPVAKTGAEGLAELVKFISQANGLQYWSVRPLGLDITVCRWV